MALVVTGCVTHVGIEGALCPCPEGYTCCANSGTCARDDSQCPTHLASSGSACVADSDCQRPGERCAAWAGSEGVLLGPKECRRRCGGDLACDANEKCRPSLHDGAPSETLDVEWLCLGATGCNDSGCDRCPENRVGQQYCDVTGLMGCFLALDRTCGVTCHPTKLSACENCVDDALGARCLTPTTSLLCGRYQCDDCPTEPVCAGTQKRECLSTKSNDVGCMRLCAVRETTCTSGCDAGACFSR